MKRISIIALAFLIFFSQTTYAYVGVDEWFEDEIAEADELGFIPDSFSNKHFRKDITRIEFIEVLMTAYSSYNHLVARPRSTDHFTDTNNSLVNYAYELGIISGYSDGSFKPNNTISRQEVFTILYRFQVKQNQAYTIDDYNAGLILNTVSDRGRIESWALNATASMFFSELVTRDINNGLRPLDNTLRAEAIVLIKRLFEDLGNQNNVANRVKLLKEAPSSLTTTSSSSSSNNNNPSTYNDSSTNETSSTTTSKSMITGNIDLSSQLYSVGYNSLKYSYVFGSLDADKYASAEEALVDMVNVTFKVWTLNADGTKTTGKKTIRVNRAIAPMVSLIFEEIYNGKEQFPIKSVMAYAWRSNVNSEHRLGLAIDINPNENYMILSDGTIRAGSFWDPELSPYSIKVEGDVVNAFNKYGFTWGGTAWRSSNDYMHFSYFGR